MAHTIPPMTGYQIHRVLAQAQLEGVFSGAAWSFGTAHEVLGSGYVGTVSSDGPDVDPRTRWDLGELTAPIVGLATMALVERGALLLDDCIATYLPQYRRTDKGSITVRQLLTHTSGLPGDVPLYRRASSRAELLEAIRELPVLIRPGAAVVVSSPGSVLLGLVSATAASTSLDELVGRIVTNPGGMLHTTFGLPADLHERAAATEFCTWRGRLVQGTVHDENAAVMGGVAGHAGLFAPLSDLETLGRGLCSSGAWPVLSAAALETMVTPATDGLNLRRALAWQGRDPVASPAGDLAGPRAYGQVGQSGTSLWVDPAAGRYVVLLTNRLHASRESGPIDRVRRLVANAAFGAVSHGPPVRPAAGGRTGGLSRPHDSGRPSVQRA
jgi:CubicO group peptidase (beta-lactamase class C family)